MELKHYQENEALTLIKAILLVLFKITNDQNKSLFPAQHLGQLGHRPPTSKSRDSHEVSEITERGVHQKITSSLLKDTTVRLAPLIKLKASGFTS